MKRLLKVLLAGALLITATPGWGHRPSDSYLRLQLDGAKPQGRWDIALRDLEYAIGLDADSDGEITWGELRARQAAITDYTLSHLQIRSGTRACSIHPREHLVDTHSDGAYAVLGFALECPNGATALTLDYGLFFDLDPTHRGLLKIESAAGVQSTILSPDQPRFEFSAGGSKAWRQVTGYWHEGVWHIWLGFDHLLFLLALLLPSVLVREHGNWRAVESLRPTVLSVAGIVTAFTVAHSITLSIAVLNAISLPARWVESAIAATVVLVAVNNLYPWLPGRPWLIAFGLGLIHGLGFATALTDLGLPGDARALALLGFNLGVETGQLIIVAGFLPLAYLLRALRFYRRTVVGVGSVAVATIGFGWLLQRAFHVRFLTF